MLEFDVFSRHLWNSSKFWRKMLLILHQILWTLDRFHSFNIVRKHTCQLWPSVIPLTSFHTSRTSLEPPAAHAATFWPRLLPRGLSLALSVLKCASAGGTRPLPRGHVRYRAYGIEMIKNFSGIVSLNDIYVLLELFGNYLWLAILYIIRSKF